MEKNTQTIFMPDGTEKAFDECLDNVQHTRDYSLYLDSLTALSENYMIIASVNDNYGRNIPDDILEKLHKLGFKGLKKIGSQRYVCVINRGEVYAEVSEEEPLRDIVLGEEINGVQLLVASYTRTTNEVAKIKNAYSWHFLRNEAKSEIKINGKDYSLNCSGMNIVVCDSDANEVIDSSTYDFALPKPTFYHKNFDFDEEYFDTHFFVQKETDDFWRRLYRKSYYSNEKLGVAEIENGIFLPVKWINGQYRGGVCDKYGNFVYGDRLFIHEINASFRHHTTCSYAVPENELDYVNEVVIYGGRLVDHPGHLILEGISFTLWYALHNTDPNVKIAVIITPCFDKQQFAFQFLSGMGISEERIILVEKPTRFKKIIAPDQGMVLYDGWLNIYSFTDQYVLPYKKIRETAKPTGFSKVYFTKRKVDDDNFLGEDYFIDFYRKKGFEIIDPEDYSISEKAGILRDADEFVTMNGTNQHYAVFCKPSAKTVILQRDNTAAIPVQALMTESVGIKDVCIVNISLDFIHQSTYFNVNLLGVTDEWIAYVKQTYDEDVGITKEEYIKAHMYEYLCLYPKYYFKRQEIFDLIKDFKALDMIKNMSEVLLGEELDTNGLDLVTREDEVNADAIFMRRLLHDVLFENKLEKYLQEKEISSVSMLCSSKGMLTAFRDIFAKLNIKVDCLCDVGKCDQVSEYEWRLCKISDVIFGYDPLRPQFGERDSIQVVDICAIV